jgi:hypothetical protein
MLMFIMAVMPIHQGGLKGTPSFRDNDGLIIWYRSWFVSGGNRVLELSACKLGQLDEVILIVVIGV